MQVSALIFAYWRPRLKLLKNKSQIFFFNIDYLFFQIHCILSEDDVILYKQK